MKRLSLTLLYTAILIFAISVVAQDSKKKTIKDTSQVQIQQVDPSKIQHGSCFVDKDGNGFNDNAPDHDGDGIPNGVDKDYNGRGKASHGQGVTAQGKRYGCKKGACCRKGRNGFGPRGTRVR